MDEIKMKYDVDGDDFTVAGNCSSKVKKLLNQLGFAPEIIRKVAIAMYEGEINMVIHANGGHIELSVEPKQIIVKLCDNGPGIEDIDKAMQAGFSTASNHVRELGFGAGMGLPNMKKYSDDMKIETQIGVGTTVTLMFNTCVEE